MCEAKFTKGPWSAGRPDMATIVDGVRSKWIYAGNDSQYCAIASGLECDDWGVVMANAHLIAAAPEMYDYLDGLHQSINLNGGVLTIDEDDCEYIGKLLAKARGEHA